MFGLAVVKQYFKREVKKSGKNTGFVNLAPAGFIPGNRRVNGFLVWLIKSCADGFCCRY